MLCKQYPAINLSPRNRYKLYRLQVYAAFFLLPKFIFVTIMNFKGNYLRVLTPRTTDGVTPQMGEDGRLVYKEDFLPLTSRPFIEKQNEKLPDILKKKIEVVKNDDGGSGTATTNATVGKAVTTSKK